MMESLWFCINMAQHEPVIQHEWTFENDSTSFLVKCLYHDQVSVLIHWNIDLTTNIGVAIEVLVWLLLSCREVVTIFRIYWWPQPFFSQFVLVTELRVLQFGL